MCRVSARLGTADFVWFALHHDPAAGSQNVKTVWDIEMHWR